MCPLPFRLNGAGTPPVVRISRALPDQHRLRRFIEAVQCLDPSQRIKLQNICSLTKNMSENLQRILIEMQDTVDALSFRKPLDVLSLQGLRRPDGPLLNCANCCTLPNQANRSKGQAAFAPTSAPVDPATEMAILKAPLTLPICEWAGRSSVCRLGTILQTRDELSKRRIQAGHQKVRWNGRGGGKREVCVRPRCGPHPVYFFFTVV